MYTIFTLFFFNDTATTEIYTLSLHDALPISAREAAAVEEEQVAVEGDRGRALIAGRVDERPQVLINTSGNRSEEHTSELQSLAYLVCRLLLEKKKINIIIVCQATITHSRLAH